MFSCAKLGQCWLGLVADEQQRTEVGVRGGQIRVEGNGSFKCLLRGRIQHPLWESNAPSILQGTVGLALQGF